MIILSSTDDNAPEPGEHGGSAQRVVVVLDPHGDNRGVVDAALDRAAAHDLDVDLVVLGELCTSLAPAMVAVDRALQQVGTATRHATVRNYVGWENDDGWADRLGGGVVAVVVSTMLVHGVSRPGFETDTPAIIEVDETLRICGDDLVRRGKP